MFAGLDLILVVDDEQSGCDELPPLFGRLGCRTKTVASIEEALSVLNDEMVAVTMPGNGLLRMDGLELLAKQRKISPDTEFIITNRNSLPHVGTDTVPEKAYDYLRKPFDLVITDLSMPGLSGWQVAERVKKQNPRVPVILVSGWAIQQDDARIRESGVDFILSKPCTLQGFQDVVKKALSSFGEQGYGRHGW